jgi:hypothetical protein
MEYQIKSNLYYLEEVAVSSKAACGHVGFPQPFVSLKQAMQEIQYWSDV